MARALDLGRPHPKRTIAIKPFKKNRCGRGYAETPGSRSSVRPHWGVCVDATLAKIASGDDELVPSGVVDRPFAGENPARVWREHRGLTIVKLAELANLDESYVSGIEERRQDRNIQALASVAAVLNVEPLDLLTV